MSIADINWFYKWPKIREPVRKLQCFIFGHHHKCLIKRKNGTHYCAWCGKELTMYPRMRYCKETELDRYIIDVKIKEKV